MEKKAREKNDNTKKILQKPIMTQITKDEIAEIDKLYLDPGERAKRIQQYLAPILFEEHQEKPWEVAIWCCETLGVYAAAMEDERFLEIVKNLLWAVYSIHYSNPLVLYGEPDRDK